MQSRELADAQEYLTGSFPLTIETPSAIALQVLNAVFYGLDLNELQTYRERVNMITVDDIQRVAQQYLHPDRLAIVLVGDASVFAKQLAGVGFDQVERIPIADLDLTLESSASPGGGPADPPGVPTKPAAPSRVRAGRAPEERELIARAVSAKGGVDLLRSIRTVQDARLTVTVESGGARRNPEHDAPFDTRASFAWTRRRRRDLSSRCSAPGGSLGPGRRAATPRRRRARRSEMRATVQRDAVPMLLALTGREAVGTRLPDVTGGGSRRTMPAIEVAPPGMPPLTRVVRSGDGAHRETRCVSLGRVPGRSRSVKKRSGTIATSDGLKVAFLAQEVVSATACRSSSGRSQFRVQRAGRFRAFQQAKLIAPCA